MSCGQFTKEEKELGRDIVEVIQHHGMQGFLAQTIHSADELNTAVFKAVHDCDGFCAVMHKRGEVKYLDYTLTQRSSVWIQQEIAILMYRRFLQGRVVPIRVFSEKGILLEGIMKTSIINPIQFEKREEVLEGVSEWLTGPEFDQDPIRLTRERLFQRRIQDLPDEDWALLDIIAAHSTSPGDMPDHGEVRKDFRLYYVEHDGAFEEAHVKFNQANANLQDRGIVIYFREGGITHGPGIAKEWFDYVLEELRNRGRRPT